MSEKCFRVIVNKISSVKIVCTIWLNNYQILACCEGNTVLLYKVFEGKNHLFAFIYY